MINMHYQKNVKYQRSNSDGLRSVGNWSLPKELPMDAYVEITDRQHPSVTYRIKLLCVFIDGFTDGCSPVNLPTDLGSR